MSSWKTTAAGIAAIIVAIGVAVGAYCDNDPATVINVELLVAGITAGIGLILARDNDKSSETVGAK